MSDPSPPAAGAAEPAAAPGELRPAGPRLSLFGALIAAWSSMCGIGGGLFAVPVLHFLERLPLKEAVAVGFSDGADSFGGAGSPALPWVAPIRIATRLHRQRCETFW